MATTELPWIPFCHSHHLLHWPLLCHLNLTGSPTRSAWSHMVTRSHPVGPFMPHLCGPRSSPVPAALITF